MSTTQISINDIRHTISVLNIELDLKKKLVSPLKSQIDQLTSKLAIIDESIDLARRCSELTLELVSHIENIISTGLSEVFDRPYKFLFEHVLDDDGKLRGLRPRLQVDNGAFSDPLNDYGMGVVSMMNVCFKIAILLLTPNTNKMIVFDEPLANVSPLLQYRFQLFIKNICTKSGLQLIMITHMDDPFGTVWEVVKTKKKKYPREVSSIRKYEKTTTKNK